MISCRPYYAFQCPNQKLSSILDVILSRAFGIFAGFIIFPLIKITAYSYPRRTPSIQRPPSKSRACVLVAYVQLYPPPMMKQKRLRLTLAWGVYGFTQAREGMRNFLLQTFPLNMYVSTNTFLSPAQTYQTFRNTSERAGGLFGVWY